MTREGARAALNAAVARLVARAAAERWPIRADHCFLRIGYDNAVGAKWDTVVKAPAWRNLPVDRIEAAAAVLGQIEAEGRVALDALNAASLGYRGKLRP
ncbi:GCN5-related N-acetyltransferase [Glacieibacterium frigidum]|uniref:GCN5-related N-acetyltransferase n=1 Tax=Glacieibacterium frigidum TaxID=2593303 RepID=A0A552U7W4_9SPHN|nr:GCN5-related N-acetyltransferase [Glacieibacterium frigidum]TRW14310.1 GCN5-related N-acetyltransferase [Glacieibacterium frigidum]